MRSDKIEHRYKKIHKKDVTDLKFALNLLEICCTSGGIQPTGGTSAASNPMVASGTTACAPNNLSGSLDKSSASIKNSEQQTTRFDDHFDKKTRRLVRRFKRRENLSNDSRVDKETWDCIIEAAIEKARKHLNLNRFQLESV